MRSSIEIIEEIGAATTAQDKHCTVMCEDATFEDGVIAALLWVIGSEGQTSLMVESLTEFEQANGFVNAKEVAA
ncbi:hypothetical protein A9Q81_24260 [Gammaproteobacteria bacterium 42_54_T18]|nr:hypothetical protein A9Q81_24260 [Gammaproteobacteria bacterium 42_54_T18]